MQGDAQGAMRSAEEGLRSRRHDPDLTYLLGASQLYAGRVVQAIATLERAATMRAVEHVARVHLASAYRIEDRLPEAYEQLDKVLAAEPGHEMAASAKAEMLILEGDFDASESLLEPFVERDDVHPTIGAAWGQLMLSRREPDRAIEIVRTASLDPREGPAGRVRPTFLLADLLDRAGRYDDAFEAYALANSLKGLPHSAAEQTRAFDTMINAWTPGIVERLPRTTGEAGETQQPVFVVGMPRSGTSLIEQILSCLDGVHASGELEYVNRAVYNMMSPLGLGTVHIITQPQLMMPGSVQELADTVLGQMREHGGDALRIIDKAPMNFRNLGLISALFPRARVIHCVRDPRDTCLSCYFQNFGSSISFAYDLEDLGRYYRDYQRVMEHWKSVLDLQIHDVVYEELVAEPEQVMRGMVEFMGLAWDERCLEFHNADRVTLTASNDQVRRPLYKSSIARWERYKDHLGQLERALSGEV